MQPLSVNTGWGLLKSKEMLVKQFSSEAMAYALQNLQAIMFVMLL
jgi:hypothetical protein